jgi:NADH-quinone oxidoreductase subunit J
MVLILFVLMLLSLHDERHFGRSGIFQRLLAPLATLALIGTLVSAATLGAATDEESGFPVVEEGFGTVSALGLDLFTRFFYPFEVISLLLVVAMVGAVLLAKRRL